ncbi:MAG TPA: hypothetical protein VK601_26995 [Kofleriaceae bacterium]|nr:hypothetical protein [Kofleriaceae bacterium]
MAIALALAGCLDSAHHARAEGSCVISGCADEVCGAQPEFSPCIWRDAYVCFRDATCARQADGGCGWSQTSELEACLAAHEPLPGSQP